MENLSPSPIFQRGASSQIQTSSIEKESRSTLRKSLAVLLQAYMVNIVLIFGLNNWILKKRGILTFSRISEERSEMTLIPENLKCYTDSSVRGVEARNLNQVYFTVSTMCPLTGGSRVLLWWTPEQRGSHCHWTIGRDWKTFEKHDRKSLGCLEETVGRNMDVKGYSGECSEKRRN